MLVHKHVVSVTRSRGFSINLGDSFWYIEEHYGPAQKELTNKDLVAPHGDIDLGQHRLRYWFLPDWRHQSITWTGWFTIDKVPWNKS